MATVHGTTAAASTNPVDQLIGERYRLSARLGRGQLGEIYEARDELGRAPGMDRHVAIQLIDERLAARPQFAEEFERGAAELQAISHPNIIGLLDFGRDGSRYFLVMEHPESASLRFLLDDVMALPIEETAAIVRAVGDALQHLHAKGFVHGNLKPETVLVTFDYKVKLQDVAPRGWLSQAPEIRDDVYALACLTYELLAGRHPFNANTPSEALRAGLEPLPIDGLLPRQWLAITLGLVLNRERRTPTVAEFLQEFGITGVERLRTTIPGVAASRRTPAPPAPQPALPAVQSMLPAPQPVRVPVVERYTRRRTRSRAVFGGPLSLVVVAGLAALTFAYYDRVRDWTAELLAATDATVRDANVAHRSESSGATVPASPSVIAAEPSDVVAPASVPQAEQDAVDAPAAASSGSGKPVAPGSQFSFAQSRATVSEGEVAARVVAQRTGDTTRAATFVWWTAQDTAIAGEDYADLGPRVEKFPPGERSHVIYIPLVNDAIAEPTKSFNVYLGRNDPGRNPADPIAGVRIDIVDDD